jgi:hypothetical protein
MSTKAAPLKNPVIAALDAGARLRRHAANGATKPDALGCTVAVIDAAAEKIEANDLSAFESALAAQGLALHLIFEQFVGRSAKAGRLAGDPMYLALRAQSQCRLTFKSLAALQNSLASQNSRKRTIEERKYQHNQPFRKPRATDRHPGAGE